MLSCKIRTGEEKKIERERLLLNKEQQPLPIYRKNGLLT